MEKSKILIFTDWYEPGFKAGGPIRSCVNFADHMKEDYDIYVFTGDRDSGDDESYPGIETDRWIENRGTRLFYASPIFLKWSAILQLIRETQPDFVYLNNMYSRYFTIYPLLMKKRRLIHAKVILAPRGMLQQGAIQFKTKKKKLFLKLLNLLKIPAQIHGQATDEQEKTDFLRYLPGIRSVFVIPNFPSEVPQTLVPVQKCKGELHLVFISRISPKKNLLFLLSLLKNIPDRFRVDLTIRGGIENTAYWTNCASAIQKLPYHVSVRYEGPINHNEVTAIIRQHHLFVLPTLGENFGHAIFEAIAAGRPVLISDQTPWRNLQEQHAGWDLPLNDQAAFIKVLQEVADMDNETFQQWSRGAWNYAKGFSDSSGLKEKYRELFS